MLSLAESLGDPPASDPQRDRQALADTLSAFEQLLGFDLLEFPADPPGFHLDWIYGGFGGDMFLFEYWSDDGRVRLAFWQGFGEPPADSEWDSIPPAEIETVQIGKNAGQYARGEFLGDRSSPWADEKPVQRLRWQAGGRWFELVLEGESPAVGHLDKPWLVGLAENLR
jgi:hypothetical protein